MDLNRKALWRGALAGAVAGTAGTLAMDLVSQLWSRALRGKRSNEESLSHQGGRPDVEAAKKAGLGGEDRGAVATTRVADGLAESSGKSLSPKDRKRGGTVIHYSYGAAMGMLYGAIVESIPPIHSGHGVMYGLLVWMGSVQIALPMTGLSRGPTKYSTGEHVFSALSHAVFGLITEAAHRRLASRPE